jgi:hypothetical protein
MSHGGEPGFAIAEPALHYEGARSDRGQRTNLFSHQNRVPQGEQEQAPGGSAAPLCEKTPEHRCALIIGRG